MINAWSQASIRDVAPCARRHTIHTYFNCCPESPDGAHILFFASGTREAHFGDVIIMERATGAERVIAAGVHTEDAHRAACQQWVAGGAFAVWHAVEGGVWRVYAHEVASGETRVIAHGRQLGFASAASAQIPLYGMHWNPGAARDLQIHDLASGRVSTPVRADAVAAAHAAWAAEAFPREGAPLSIFFPVVSPDGSKVLFKLSRGRGGGDFRSADASVRLGKFVYDLRTGRELHFAGEWGHPSWHPDSWHVLDIRRTPRYQNLLTDLRNGVVSELLLIPTDHPSFSPDGALFVSDGKQDIMTFERTGLRGVWVAQAVARDDIPSGRGSVESGAGVVAPRTADVELGASASDPRTANVDLFVCVNGAESWRRSHAHPVFNSDGTRIYYNVNDGEWTRLRVAERLLVNGK